MLGVVCSSLFVILVCVVIVCRCSCLLLFDVVSFVLFVVWCLVCSFIVACSLLFVICCVLGVV